MTLFDTNLTNPYGKKGRQYSQTFPGMASWAGGTPGKTCRECEFFQTNGYYSANGKHRGGLKPGTCAEYKKLMGHKGPAFSFRAKACNKFNQADDPPNSGSGFQWT